MPMARICSQILNLLDWGKWGKLGKRGEKWEKVAKIGEKWWKVAKSDKKMGKIVKSAEKWQKVWNSSEKLEKVAKSGENWRKVGKMAKSWNKWGKLGKRGEKWQKVAKSCKMAAASHFGWPKITFDRISRHFRSIRNFIFFLYFFSKWPLAAVRSPICAKNNRVPPPPALPLYVINGYAKYEVGRWICDTVRDATSCLSIFIQSGRQRPFCFSDWWQKS